MSLHAERAARHHLRVTVRVDTNRPTELWRRPAAQPAVVRRRSAPDSRRRDAGGDRAAEPSPCSVPRPFGRYDVYEEIGRGGLATVHHAVDRNAERLGVARPIALERLRSQFAGDWELVAVFLAEAHLTSQLEHPNIARTYAYGRIDGEHYCATELVEGPTLAQLLRQCRTAAGAIPVPVVIELLIQLTGALHYLHTRQVALVHNELTADNLVLARSGQLKLIDFARACPGVDPRSDLRMVGKLAHELLVGERISGARRGPPSRWNDAVSADLDDIVMLALRRDLGERWQNAAAMRFALRAVAAEYEGTGGPSNVREWTAWAFTRAPRRDSTKVRRLVDALDRSFRAAS